MKLADIKDRTLQMLIALQKGDKKFAPKTFSDWNVLRENSLTKEEKAFAESKMTDLAKTFAEFEFLFFNISQEHDANNTVFSRMVSLAHTFDELSTIFQFSHLPAETNTALEKMWMCGESFEVWRKLYHECKMRPIKDELVLEKIGAFNRPFKVWQVLRRESGGGIKSLALKKMAETATTFEEWQIVYNVSSDDIKIAALRKLAELTV